MRGLGYALIVIGIISAVLIFLYSAVLGWSGLIGSVTAVLTGVGFISCNPCGVCQQNNCGCNRY